MRLADAPPPGWYPDPTGGSRLRWWEGTDWSDLYRAPPSPSEIDIKAHHGQAPSITDVEQHTGAQRSPPELTGLTRRDAEEIIAEVRQVARSEVNRAADVFSQRAQAATRQIQPLITEYTSKFKRWFRIAVVIIPIVVLAWFLFEAFVQISFFEWIQDRIDNLTD